METPVHIDFQGMEPKEKLHAAIARHVAELEKRFGRITACRVVLKGPGQHHRTGGLFEVHIRLALPDEKEANVGHKPDSDERHADVNFAISDAFKRARRGLQDQVRRLQGHVKTHEPRADAAWPTTESAADKTSN
jgi:ribosome-associated translation inhibitor RaiA